MTGALEQRPLVVVASSTWEGSPPDEGAAALRGVAAGISRTWDVAIIDVSSSAAAHADGAFCMWTSDQVTARLGAERNGTQPVLAIVAEADAAARGALATCLPDVPLVSVGTSTTNPDASLVRLCVDVPPTDPAAIRSTDHHVGLFVRVHPGASERRHEGVRSLPPYLVVLDEPDPAAKLGKPGAVLAEPGTEGAPSETARWLLARFPTRHVVVVRDATASVWRSRSISHRFAVHTRMDLWLLMAGSCGVVDLAPGPLFGRECVEAIRYDLPVVLRTGCGADGIVGAGGALGFTALGELYDDVEALGDAATSSRLVDAGRELAETWYAGADRFVERLRVALEPTVPTTARVGERRERSPRPRP